MGIDRHRRIQNDVGSIIETYERGGKLHREEGPACITRTSDGLVLEGYYRDGKPRDPGDGAALVERRPDGTVYEEYIMQNEKDEEVALSAILRHPDGTLEYFFQEDGPSRKGTAEMALALTRLLL